jgi:hypothetical protein
VPGDTGEKLDHGQSATDQHPDGRDALSGLHLLDDWF